MNLGLAYYGRTEVECNRRSLDEWGCCGRAVTGCKQVGLARGGFDFHEWKIRDMGKRRRDACGVGRRRNIDREAV